MIRWGSCCRLHQGLHIKQHEHPLRRSRAAADDAAWAASLQAASWPLPPARPSPPLLAQLRQLSGRLLRRAYRHPFLIALNFLAALATAAGLGITFYATGYETGGIQSR